MSTRSAMWPAMVEEVRPDMFVVICGCGYRSSTEWTSTSHAVAQAEHFDNHCTGNSPSQHLEDQ